MLPVGQPLRFRSMPRRLHTLAGLHCRVLLPCDDYRGQDEQQGAQRVPLQYSNSIRFDLSIPSFISIQLLVRRSLLTGSR